MTTKTSTNQTAKSSNPAALTCAIVALACSVAACGYCAYDFLTDKGGIVTYSSNGNSITFTEGSIAEIANKVSPAVVSIAVSYESTDFFGQSSTTSGGGTGMIVSSAGYILTNKHVIANATDVNIITADGTCFEDITLVGEDPFNDVAFLKINDLNGRNLPTVALGDSKTLSVGQQVLAVGNALGEYQNTVTAGIISGVGRSVTATASDYSSVESLSDMIQTDAAINAGNSGGPLVNAAGEVIGINTATSSAEAIGFAIPISSVKGMLTEILTTGKATRAYLGVRYINLTPTIAKNYGLDVTNGAFAHSSGGTPAIIKGGPAEAAGLLNEDIITAINGTKIGTGTSLSTLLGEYRPGDRISLTIIRNGEELTVSATLGEYHE